MSESTPRRRTEPQSHADRNGRQSVELGDFTKTWRVAPIALLAIAIGAVSSVIALMLPRLAGLFTNIFYYQRWNSAMVSPAGSHLGLYAIIPPVVGALIVGLMARCGSARIRGHGIPEATEAILINGSRVNGSRVEPKVALLKPL